ncbi:GNAT family N-acetyltransferase [Cupriavidus sp. CuC1]|uniref:GNAT family N-acetyltransferase n=1 Tax=Cupriavidus sp. CuC1 TaxID=3373131 RepID=UPI0037D54767
MARDLQIRPAQEADWRAISQVLDSCGLPSDDVDLSSSFFHIAVLDEEVVGCACAEQYGQTAVVRSVAVLQEHRDPRVATRLVGAVLARACAEGCTKAVVVMADEHRPFGQIHSLLTATDSMPEEVKLSKGLLRRFGATGNDMCRRLD